MALARKRHYKRGKTVHSHQNDHPFLHFNPMQYDNNDERPNKDARVMMELELMAQWATCQRGRVASALVNMDRAILVPARNGAPYGMPACRFTEDVQVRCQKCVHSEKNVINHAARFGVRTEGKDLFSLKRPCLSCANDIIQAGIAAVYYREDYHSDGQETYVLNMLRENQIFVIKLDMTPQEISFSKMLAEWRKTWTQEI